MYGFGKVLGTQNRPNLGLVSSYCVLYLNPIKGKLNIVILNSHTHTLAFIYVINMAFYLKTLTYIYRGISPKA